VTFDAYERVSQAQERISREQIVLRRVTVAAAVLSAIATVLSVIVTWNQTRLHKPIVRLSPTPIFRDIHLSDDPKTWCESSPNIVFSVQVINAGSQDTDISDASIQISFTTKKNQATVDAYPIAQHFPYRIPSFATRALKFYFACSEIDRRLESAFENPKDSANVTLYVKTGDAVVADSVSCYRWIVFCIAAPQSQTASAFKGLGQTDVALARTVLRPSHIRMLSSRNRVSLVQVTRSCQCPNTGFAWPA
jgi:hypothetical protein